MKNCLFARLVIGMLCLVVLMSACGRDVQPTLPQETGETTEPSEKTSIPETVDYEVVELKERDLYVLYPEYCNIDYYFDLAGSYFYPIYIISRTAIDTGSISADACGTENETLRIVDYKTEVMTYEYVNNSNLDYFDYLYYTQKGLDWKTAAELFQMYAEASRASEEAMGTDQALREKSAKAWADYEEYSGQYAEAYAQEKKSIIDNYQYYVYFVGVDFAVPTEEETVSEILLDISGEQQKLSVGRICLHRSFYERFGLPNVECEGISDHSLGALKSIPAWNDGQLKEALYFNADEDLTLKKLELITDNGAVITDIMVYCTTAAGQSYNSEWDGVTDLYIDAGDSFNLELSLYDPNMAGKFDYFGVVHLVVHYSTENDDYVLPVGIGLETAQNPFDLCAMFLEGTDLRSYYVDFYALWKQYIGW